MEILSWNIQAAKGVDEITSVERIAGDIKSFSNADVICLQEVLRTPEVDQVSKLCECFPEYEAVFGAAINRLYPTGRLEFGNLILLKLPILQINHHKLPQPAEPAQKHMPRQAIELILLNGSEFLRVTTLHLDYYAVHQRAAQVRYLADHYQECQARFKSPSPSGGEEQFASMPETSRSVYCGDFNLAVDSEDYKIMTESSIGCGLVDCWRHIKGQQPHDPTCGIFDHVQWQEGAHCRDFFFVSPDVAENLNDMSVQTKTAASDHQPLKIIINE